MARRDTIVAMVMVTAVGATTDRRSIYASFLKEKGPSGGPFLFPAALRHEALEPVPGNSPPC
jgi:hypothetical protein